MWFLALLSTTLSLVLVAFSVLPGMLEQIPLRMAMIAAGVYGLFAFAAMAWHWFRSKRADRPRRRVSLGVILVTFALTPLLLASYTPRRLVFWCYESQLDALLPQAPLAGDHAVAALNANLDIYWIDEWGTDPRGGIYFRTLAGRDLSYGFAYRPNSQGSPFGDAHYSLQHLTGDWYSFAAADKS